MHDFRTMDDNWYSVVVILNFSLVTKDIIVHYKDYENVKTVNFIAVDNYVNYFTLHIINSVVDLDCSSIFKPYDLV